MKMSIRIIALLASLILLLSTLGCTQAPAETTPSTTAPQQTTPSTTAPKETVPPTTAPEDPEETEPTEAPQEPAITPEEIYQQTENPILTARRDTAEAYMRNMATFLWRAEENIVYAQNSTQTSEEELIGYQGTVIRYRAGQLYRGVPYTNSRSPGVNFFDYASEPDENGIHSVSGLHGRALAGKENGGFARVGNDCCSSIQQAWNYIGADIKSVHTTSMKEASGYLPVGIYTRDDTKPLTVDICAENGEQVMFASYAALKKADAVVRYNDNIGHAMMAVKVVTIFKGDGTIDGDKSYVTFLHQTNAYIKNEKFVYDEELGERVYLTYGIDDVITFTTLYKNGYLPVTCDVLVDPEAKGFEDYVIDSEKEHTFENILKGTFHTKWLISNVTITITDKNGEVVTAAMRYALSQRRTSNYSFQLAERFAGPSSGVDWGDLKLDELTPGTYHCTHVLRNAHGAEYTMRDFDFTVS